MRNLVMLIRKQWKRSSLRGFFSRLSQYVSGIPCYSCTGGRMFLTSQSVTGDSVTEQYECDGCEATLGSVF